jgi:energy-converting hydrogenase Eha subunit A
MRMTLLPKMRDRRESWRVSTISGSPIAASMRSAAVA